MNVDVLVIGAGTAGEYAALEAKKHTDSVAIAERVKAGGDCIYHACVPSKALVYAARAYDSIRNAGLFGLPVITQKADYQKVKAYKDRIVTRMSDGADEEIESAGIRLVRGAARFVTPNKVVVGEETIEAKKIIISTGSGPSAPPIPGLSETGYITNVEALDLEQVPERLAIIGGGAVGVEFARIFSTFGAKVQIYEAVDRILVNEDEEVSEALTGILAKRNVTVSASAKIERIEKSQVGKLVITKNLSGDLDHNEFDEILVATGRKPNIEGLNLEAAGVEYTRKGIKIDASLQTSVPHIWAAGDVAGPFLFTFIAWEQGEAAAVNATTSNRRELNYDVLPKATFCDPEVASVGLTERLAREKGFNVKAGKFDYDSLVSAMVSGETAGFIKIVADADSGRILGGHIMGTQASVLIHEIAVAMRAHMTVSQVGSMIHAYPTLSEGIRNACQSAE